MRRLAAALAALTVAGCAGPGPAARWLTPVEGAPSHRFVAREHGDWRVTPWPPRFPLNAEATPPLRAMTGAATVRPYGCGVDATRGDYFTVPHGRLVCALGAPDGAIHVGPVGDGLYDAVFDAHSDWRIVLARRHGSAEVEALVETPRGLTATRLTGAPGARVAFALGRDRVAVLHGDGARDPDCRWTLFTIAEGVARPETDLAGVGCNPGDNARLLRDQNGGEPFLWTSDGEEHVLYRLNLLGPAGDTRFPTVIRGTATAQVILDGVLYYAAGGDADRGPMIGAVDLGARHHRLLAYPGPGPEPADSGTGPSGPHGIRLTTGPLAPSFFAFVIPQSPGDALRVVISDERGLLRVRSLDEAVPVT